MKQPSRMALTLACAAAAVLGAFGCGNGNLNNANSITLPTNVQRLSDPQVTHIAMTINNGEIAAANAALPRLSNSLVRAFAQRMINEHTGSNARLSSLAFSQNIVAVDNPVSAALDEETQTLVGQLNGINNSELDAAYLSSQVRMHAQALSLIDCSLAPNTLNSRIFTFVDAEMRNDVLNHLNEALRLRDTLGISNNGEGNVIACQNLCATGFAQVAQTNSAPFLAPGLASTVCTR